MRNAMVILTPLVLLSPAFGQTPDAVRQILAAHCGGCHSSDAKKVKGNLRIDQLSPEFDAKSREAWRTIAKRIEAGEMPPESRPALPAGDKKKLLDWIGAGVKAADARRLGEGRAVLRRLNRVEYQNTLRDLFGISIDVVDALPLDSAAAGFDNVSEAQHVSTFLLERYLEAADKAIGLAIANNAKPPLLKKRYSLKETHQVKVSTERVYRHEDDGTIVCFSSSPWNSVVLSPFYPPDRGLYRIRITTSAVHSDKKPVVYRVDAGPMLMATRNHLVGYFDAQPGEPAAVEFTDYFEARTTIRIHPYGLSNAQTVHKIGAADYKGPGLAVHHVEVEGPLHESWPPASHVRLFGDLTRAAVKNNRFEVASDNPEEDAARILTKFARRAFRRDVAAADIAPYLKLVRTRLADKAGFEQAVRVGLAGMLVSKDFLFLRESAGTLDDFALASRLSYFLWSTMPDDELLDLAGKQQLGDPKTLRAQVERMLKDKKAAQFTENFVGQWLGLREIDATSPSHILYPEYDEMLKESMLRETYLFFDEILKGDLSIANFIDSDFAMLNGRLARHYGIPGVEGWTFKKTPLPPGCHRGGVLTMASVLKVTANGTYTSPILRGAWVLDRLLGAPSPQPPEGVSVVDPDIRGATTIRQQLAKHRQSATCASCHAKIDPPGFALECFDVIGGYREFYRTSGNGKPVVIDGKRMNYLHGPAVDAADVLPDGRKFAGIDEYKKLLMSDREQVTRNLASRLVTYATGAAVQPGDAPAIEAIVRRVHPNDGLRTLVHKIVQSDLFRKK